MTRHFTSRAFLAFIRLGVLAFQVFTVALALAAPLQWETGSGYRSARMTVPSSNRIGFKLMPVSETAISFTNVLPDSRSMTNWNLLNGSGVALGDYDRDGLCDIYLCNMTGPNRLFKNLGNWKFKDATDAAGVACPGQTSTGAVFADIDGDGDLDLIVTSMGGPNACFLNDGRGHFANATAECGLLSRRGSTSMALADVNGDGALDLYVANYGATSILRSGGNISVTYVNGQPVVHGRYAQQIKIINGVMYELGEPHFLYLNDGKGKFTPVSWTDGTFRDAEGKPLSETPRDHGLSVIFRDLNGDGAPDIFVCNDFYDPDRIWMNDSRGHFQALGHKAWRSTSYFSMGVDVADINRDGFPDLLTVDMLSRQHQLDLTQKSSMDPQVRAPGSIESLIQMRRNALSLNRGDGSYAEIAHYAGVAASEWSWSCIFLDVDLDGWEDILITNGNPRNFDDRDAQAQITSLPQRSQRALLLFPPLLTPNVAFENRRNLTFRETGKEWGFDSSDVSNGMALADLDNDGDLDVVVNCLNAAALLYRNEAPASRLAVRLKGNPPNTQGIGARITIRGGPITQTQEVICGGRYVSGDDPMRVFAAGDSTNLTIEVVWRNGKRSELHHARPNYVYEIDEAVSKLLAAPETATNLVKLPPQEPGAGTRSIASVEHPQSKNSDAVERVAPHVVQAFNAQTFLGNSLFDDMSHLLNHEHHEEAFNDFAMQPLLPKRLSQLGPGVCWFDVDGDGNDDLIVGSGKGGALAVFRNNGQVGFTALKSPVLSRVLADDATGIVAFTGRDGARTLLVGLANYETSASTNLPSVLRFDWDGNQLVEGPPIPAILSSTGPLALADIDADGDLELFVGGRVKAGRYPEAANSRIFRNENKQWVLDTQRSEPLRGIGLISGAVFSDLNGDGWPELILACEWGLIRVFKNDRGHLREATSELGLSHLTGLWTSVTTGDFDGDGRLDMVAGNWGLNSFYSRAPKGPWHLYFGDFNGDGQIESIEAYPDVPLQKIVPWRDMQLIGSSLPWVRDRWLTHRQFAQASVSDILRDQMQKATDLSIKTLASTIFLNRGDHFESMPLPAPAQWSPAMGVCVGDLDGDGNEDLFLSQNYFAVRTEDNPLDTGRGLWLKGDGRGGFSEVPGRESGLLIYGEQRGAALCDYDRDGRLDLVVTQNGAATKLFHNSQSKPGLRVRLTGSPENPAGVGACVRLISNGQPGAQHEIHAGNGYWSQESTTAVLASAAPPTQIWVRWPGGKTVTAKLPANARKVSVDLQGMVHVTESGTESK